MNFGKILMIDKWKITSLFFVFSFFLLKTTNRCVFRWWWGWRNSRDNVDKYRSIIVNLGHRPSIIKQIRWRICTKTFDHYLCSYAVLFGTFSSNRFDKFFAFLLIFINLSSFSTRSEKEIVPMTNQNDNVVLLGDIEQKLTQQVRCNIFFIEYRSSPCYCSLKI